MEYIPEKSSPSNMVYEQLDTTSAQIRILRLEPGSFDDDIHGTLSTVCTKASDVELHYEAISYYWGDSAAKGMMLLDGMVFEAPATAIGALRYIRDKDEPRSLWIDSICINQCDLQEREHQVGLMARIYSSASRTLVWLGEADDETENAVNTCERFGEVIFKQAKDVRDLYGMIDVIELPENADITAIGPILRRPYFTRLWVYQEVILARDCHCYIGNFGLRWALLEMIVPIIHSRCDHETKTKVFGGDDMIDMRSRSLPVWTYVERFAVPRDQKLSNLIQRTRDLDASDPRDKVYGVLGLADAFRSRSSSNVSVRVDYSVSIECCIREAVKAMIREDGNLLSLVDQNRWPFPQLGGELTPWPSWAPRFDKIPKDLKQYPWTYAINEKTFRADNGRSLILGEQALDDHPNALFIGGIRYGTVAEALEEFGEDVLRINFTMCQLTNLLLPGYGFTWFKTILAGIYNKDLVQGSDEFTFFWLSFKQSMDLLWYNFIHWMSQNNLSSELQDCWYRATSVCQHRRLFTTSAGDLGLGPASMEKDDIICVLFGAPWPVVLRPKNGYYEFIQPCYVDAIMDGEAVRKWEEQGEEPEMFELR